MAGPGTDPRGQPSPAARRPHAARHRGALLGFAVLITVVAQCIVDLTITGSLRPEMATFSAWITALWVVAHLVVRKWRRLRRPAAAARASRCWWASGLAVIHRLDLAGSSVDGTATREDAPVQLIWATLGVALFVAVLLVVRDHRVLSRYAYTLALIGLVAAGAAGGAARANSEVNGAKIWIRVAGFSIQPGEFAKICLVVFFAAYLVDKRDVLALASRRVLGLELPRGRDLGPVLLAWVRRSSCWSSSATWAARCCCSGSSW